MAIDRFNLFTPKLGSIIPKQDFIHSTIKQQPIPKIASVAPPVNKTVVPQPQLDAMGKAVTSANAVNAVNAGVSIGLGIYGMSQINKMKDPETIYSPTLEAAKIKDRGAQISASNRTSADRSINTARNTMIRSGRTEMLPGLTAKSLDADNQIGANIENMRMRIDEINTSAENRIREINASNKLNTSQLNSNIQQSFRQYKDSMSSQVLTNTLQNTSQNMSGIAGNLYGYTMYKEGLEREKELTDIYRRNAVASQITGGE